MRGQRGFLVLFLVLISVHVRASAPFSIKTDIDWGSFLGRNDLVWEVLPGNFDYGAFLGNGLLGATLYADRENRFRWEMGCTEVTEHRRDNARLPIGGLVLTTVGKITGGTMRLDLWNAEVRGTLNTDRGTVTFRSFIHAVDPVLVTDLHAAGGEEGARLAWKARPCVDPRNGRHYGDPPNPPALSRTVKGLSVCTQDRYAGGRFSTAWRVTGKGRDRRFFISVADSFPDRTAERKAVDSVLTAMDRDPGQLLASHRKWWHAFYPKNFVSLPDPRIESFYWIQWYKLASASRPDSRPVDLLGPWFRHTRWPRIWWNMNIQSLYVPVYTGNRLELGESFVKFIDEKRDNFYKNAKALWHFDNCATVPHTTDYEGLRGNGSAAPRGYINPGDFTWGLYNYYLHYRYSMDHSIVTDQGRHAFYPLLRDSVNLYLNLLERGKDGKLHLPKLHSPEYGNDKDNNYNLSLLRWGCQTLIALNRRYGLGDPRVPVWERTLRDLVPYPTDKNGLRIGKDLAYVRSHRHWSHLLMIHPLHIMTGESAAERDLMKKSIGYWLTAGGGGGINGWSRAGAASLYASLGDGENAYRQVIGHPADTRSVRPNTMYIEGSPVLESSVVLNRSVQDMILQSWGGKIAVFPAVPARWGDLVFHDLRAEGAFLVSAVRKGGKTRWIRIKSLAGEPCRVEPLMEGKITLLRDTGSRAVTLSGEGTLDLKLARGEEILLYTGEKIPACVVSPLPVTPEGRNPWGMKVRARR